MAQNPVPRRARAEQRLGLLSAAVAVAVLALLPLQRVTQAQEPAPAAGGRGYWEGDKTSFSGLHSVQLNLVERFTRMEPQMNVYSGAAVEGRQPVREFGDGKE
jgi:hypothetical protein